MALQNRRDFLQASAATAAAITLGPLAHEARAEVAALDTAKSTGGPGAREIEDKLLRARPVPLTDVRVTGGPAKLAQDADAKYLLELEPDRMMAYYRVRAGLPKKAEPYAGWDGGGRNLTGHIAGHYLSAVSLMYAATGDERFKQRASYLVRELKEVQDKNGDGYLSALENCREAFAQVSKGDIRPGAFDLNGLWSPWYTLHKTFAGLRDAYRYTGDRTALNVEAKYAEWAEGVLKPLSDTQVQKMLLTEHGGMNEVLADLYVDTGDKRWLDLSYRFEHHAFTDALKRGQDNLAGKHVNCQIPKVIGSAARYGYTADTGDILAASTFWDRAVEHHTYATGGQGNAEYFGVADVLGSRVDGRTCESCNCYNMLKLSRRLFSFRPDPFYADFEERVLFNHVLASMDPANARMSYMVPVGRGVQQEYQNMQQSFTCCVGTGMENHALHGYGIYYESDDTLWVNLFVPSTAKFKLANAQLAQDTSFPDGDSATIKLTLPKAAKFTLAVRRPAWAGDGFAVKVNGAPIEVPPLASLRAGAAGGRLMGNEDSLPQPSSFVEISRTWNNSDTIELALPKSLRLEATPDDKRIAAIMWGPLVLAGDLGPRRESRGEGGPGAPAPMLVAAEHPVSEWVLPGARPGDFQVHNVARAVSQPAQTGDVSLTPFYRTHERTYSVYFDVVTPTEFDARVAAVAAERERVRRLEAATVAFVRPGDPQTEGNFGYKSEPADRQAARTNGRPSRAGTGWFSYDLAANAATPTALVVTYFNEIGLPPALGNFEIDVDGTQVGRFEASRTAVGFFDARYDVPASLLQGKSKITVRFQAIGNGRIAPVFGVRVVRANEL
jgi:DUF1680 family protein